MKLSKVLQAVAGVAALGFGMSAQAVPVNWTDEAGSFTYLAQGQTYQYSHNIIDNGYNASTDTITAASLTIKLFDDHLSSIFPILENPFEEETVGFRFDGGAWIQDEVDGWLFESDEFNFITLTSLLTDGVLNVAIKAYNGDFVFANSTLEVSANRASVPEPATLGMFGLGVLAVGFAARRRTAK